MEFSCDFTWGVWTAYFGKNYMAKYDFSGRVYAENGEIRTVSRIEFIHDDWGPFVRSRRYVPCEGTAFSSQVQNWFEGIRITGNGTEETVLGLETRMGTLRFTVGELLRKKHLSLPVGEHYSMAIIHAEGDEPWYLEQFPPEEHIYNTFQGGTDRCWFGVRGRAIGPGEKLKVDIGPDHSFDSADAGSYRYKYRLRFLISGDREQEMQARGTPRFSVSLNGTQLWSNRRFTTFHDMAAQFLEEINFSTAEPLLSGKNELIVHNQDETLTLLIPLIGIKKEPAPVLEIPRCPQWALVGHPFAIPLILNIPAARIDIAYDADLLEFAITSDTISTLPLHKQIEDLNCLVVNEAVVRVLDQGEHTFYFIPKKWAAEITITFVDKWTGERVSARIPSVYDVPEEPLHCFAGAELRCQNPLEYLDLLKQFRDNQIADLAVFRNYHNDSGNPAKLWEAAAFCRQNSIAVDSIIMEDSRIVAKAAAENCLCVGTHEHTGIFYGRDAVRNAGYSMKKAAEISVDLLRQVADTFRIKDVPVAIGDASGGSRYAYMAGFDIIRHETFVAHHMLILPNARGAARAFGKPRWGAHIATQHNAHPELEYGIRRFYIGVYLPWIMGAGFLFEEDSQFQYFKAEKMTSGDYLPAHKNTVIQGFYRYNRTHPRRGRPLVNIAILQGRYAPPASGLGIANNGDATMEAANENYPVWSHTGNNRWSWGYRQPEKGLHLLETLSPGICLTPLHQKSEKVRRFFSGSPRGEYDLLPVEADDSILRSYRLLFLLDWHTMAEDTGDYEKFYRYVENGGVLFLSVPHLSTRTDRDFLQDMEDLRLYHKGDVEKLCGVTIKGPSPVQLNHLSPAGDWQDLSLPPYSGIRLSNQRDDEDGPCRLADIELRGAVPLITGDSGRPVLVRYSIGKGMVYLLCTYAYPGHEQLKELMPGVINRLLDLHSKNYVTLGGNPQNTDAIYYSLWGTENVPDKLYLLNTDWVTAGNQKTIQLRTPTVSADFTVTEGETAEISLFNNGMIYAEDRRRDVSITLTNRNANESIYEVFGLQEFRLRIINNKEIRVIANNAPLPISGGGVNNSIYTIPAGRTQLRLLH